jgi:photoactive yellow protein
MSGQIELLTRLFDSLPVGVIVLDRRGDVVVFNREEERLAHRERDRVIGRSFFNEVAPCRMSKSSVRRSNAISNIKSCK